MKAIIIMFAVFFTLALSDLCNVGYSSNAEAEIILQQGNGYYQEGKYEEALIAYQEIIDSGASLSKEETDQMLENVRKMIEHLEKFLP